nr:hypothetical protein [Tanacetum cinerariifolium]
LQGRYGYLFEHLKARSMPRKSFATLADHLQELMFDSLPTMVEKHVKEQVQKQVLKQVRDQVPIYVAKRHILHVHPAQSQTTSVPEQQYQLYLFMKHDTQLQQQDIAIWLALQMKLRVLQETYVSGESSFGQDNEKEQGPSTLEMVARRANECIVSITEPDFKNLNKDDIKDMYLLSINVKKVNLTTPTISFPIIEKHEMFSIIYEPMHGIIYKNSKKKKRVTRHSEIHKFCDATLNKVLEGLKSYNNDVKYGYIQKDLTKDDAEYLKLFKEEIEV